MARPAFVSAALADQTIVPLPPPWVKVTGAIAVPNVRPGIEPLTVMAGQTMFSVKFCVPFGVTPLLAVMTQSLYGEEPCVPAAGVPAMVAVPFPLSVKVTPLGTVPAVRDTAIEAPPGVPVAETRNVWPVFPGWKVVLAALVNEGAWLTWNDCWTCVAAL